MDYTGTGNSLNMRHPHVLQLMMDSLRYWVLDMHVDGFRFDLAATLARELHEVDRLSAFFDLIQQDPLVSQVKLIAEPWDVGEGGYQVGNFPALWSEWNGKFRDSVRDYWRGESQTLGEFANRLSGSPDLYASNGRRPSASVNFVCAHDGFTCVTWCPTRRSTTSSMAKRIGTARPIIDPGIMGSKVPPMMPMLLAGDGSVGFAKSLMMFLNGKAIPSRGPRGEAIVDNSFLLCFNAHHEAIAFTLPSAMFGRRWQRVIDTADPDLGRHTNAIEAGGTLQVADRSVVVLQLAELAEVETAGDGDVAGEPSDGIVLAHT